MKLGIKVYVAFALGLLILVVVGVRSFIGVQQAVETNNKVASTQEVLEKLEHLLSLLKDAESGQRGFVLTGEERYLEPYNRATGEIRKEMDSLISLTKDNPAQRQSLQRLAQLSRDKLDEVQETIRLRREGGLNAALPVIRSDSGKLIMDEIRAVVAQLESREWQMLGERKSAAGEIALQNSWMVGIGFLLSLLVLSVAAVVITRTMRLAERPTRPGGGRIWPGIAIRYIFAMAMVALAMLVRHRLVSTFGPLPTFVIFYPSILLVASIAGGGPGIMSTILSVMAAAYWYFPPFGSFAIDSPNDAIALGIFGGASLFLSLLAERLRRARWAEAVSVTQEQELALLDMGNLLALDLDRRIVRWSEGCCRLYGFEALEAQGQVADELLQTCSKQPLEQIQRELLENSHWEGELTRRGKNGTELTLAILLALRRDEQGKPSAILEVSTDISSQKRADAALRESEARLQVANYELLLANDNLHMANEELQAQGEELQEQREELQTQSEDLQSQNLYLARLWEESRRTEEALVVSQERLHLALISSRMAAFDWDIVTNRHIWDDNVHSLFGTDPENFTGKAEEFYQAIHPEDRSMVQAALSCAVETTGEYETEYRAVWPDGAIRHIAARGKVHRDSTGRADRMTGICWDITESKLAMEMLRQNEERFRNVFDHAATGIAITDCTGRFSRCNAAYCSLTGYSQEELVAMEFPAMVHPQDREQYMGYIRQLLEGELPSFEIESRLIRKDGGVIWVRKFVSILRDDRGCPSHIIALVTDMTERKQTENLLRFMGQCGAGASGERFFQELACYLAQALNMEFVCIDRLEEDQLSAQTLAVFHNGRFEDNVSYTLKDTPCGDVVGRRICCFPRNVRGLFPKDVVLQELQAESYLGATLWSAQGKPIGLIAVIGRQPLADTRQAESVLQLVAVRAAGELERQQAEELLKKLNEELENRVEERTWELTRTVATLQEEIRERLRADESLQRLNRLYAVLSETNQAIVRTRSRDTIFDDFCRIAVEGGGFKLAWVGLVDEESGELKMVAANGATGYLDDIRITAKEEPAGLGPTGISVREGTYYICNDFLDSPITRPWHERGRAHGIRASASIALKQEGRVIGALTLYADKKDFFDRQQVELLLQMGSDVSFALDNILREKRRQEAEQELFEEIAERLRIVESLREKEQLLFQQSRMAAMGEMIGNIAHQWRQPLNVLGLTIQQLPLFYDLGEFNRELLDKSVLKSMELILHMSRTIDDFMNYFRPDKEKVEFKLSEAIANTLSLIDASFKKQHIGIKFVAKGDPVIYGYRNEFAQVLLNILNNARDALTERKTREPRVSITISSEEGSAVVTIADNAGGIPEEIMDRIFDPYFTTKGRHGGTGIGLFISKSIIEKNMGGRLTASNIAEGAEFRIEV